MDLYRLVAEFYHHLLVNTEEGDRAFEYLQGRGFTREIMDRFQLGYSYKGDVLLKLLTSRGYEPKTLLDAGLLRVDSNGEYRDFFYGRIMFPIRNEEGEIVAFSGRVLPSNTHPAKYLNTPDTPFFGKGELLFNLDRAKDTIKEKNVLVLFEGYFDTITAEQHGIHHVSSVMGTALTDMQIEKISSLTDRIVICFDGDKAGMQSAIRRSEELLERGFEVRLSVLPEGIDPHDFISKHGEEKFRKEIISKSLTHIEFCKEATKRKSDFNLEKDRINYSKAILAELPKVESVTEQRALLNETALDVDASIDFLKMIYKRG